MELCTCSKEAQSLALNEMFDRYYCLNCNLWKESSCVDPLCTFCEGTPDYPPYVFEEDVDSKQMFVCRSKPRTLCYKQMDRDFNIWIAFEDEEGGMWVAGKAGDYVMRNERGIYFTLSQAEFLEAYEIVTSVS